MADIFISYKREERGIAKEFADALTGLGWSVWWDPELRAGERFDDVIEAAIREARCLVVLWSKLSVGSTYVRDEASLALRLEKLVPVAIEEVNLPFRFQTLHTIQATGWDGSSTNPSYHSVLAGIERFLGEPAQKHPNPVPVQAAASGRDAVDAQPSTTASSSDRHGALTDSKVRGSGPLAHDQLVESRYEATAVARTGAMPMATREGQPKATAVTTSPKSNSWRLISVAVVLIGAVVVLISVAGGARRRQEAPPPEPAPAVAGKVSVPAQLPLTATGERPAPSATGPVAVAAGTAIANGAWAEFRCPLLNAKNPIANRAAALAPPDFSVDAARHLLLNKGGQPVSIAPATSLGPLERQQFIVVHFSAGSSKSTEAYFQQPEAIASVHVMIARDGTVKQMVPFDFAAYHAGVSSWKGVSGLNRYSLGIDLENWGPLELRDGAWTTWSGRVVPGDEVLVFGEPPKPWQTYTGPQLESFVKVACALRQAYPSLEGLVGHEQISPGRKNDPGPAFPLAEMQKLVFGTVGAGARTAASTTVTTPTAGQIVKDCDDCPTLVVLPMGSYRMGSPDSEKDRHPAEGPLHEVRIGYRLAVGKYELTRWEFARFATATGYKTEAERSQGCGVWSGKWERGADRNWRNPGFVQADSHPVVCVSWSDAQAYLDWLNKKAPGKGFRLLSEAEWEYAARAGQGAIRYPWGDDANASDLCTWANAADSTAKARVPDAAGWTVANCNDGVTYTAPAEALKPNAFGLHHMHGNAWEWVQDVWHDNYTGAPGDGTAWVAGGDPTRRVLRGGSWDYGPGSLRSAYRGRNAPDDRYNSTGLRIARPI